MWPNDVTVASTLDHAFLACDQGGYGTVFVRHMNIDPSGRRGGYKIADITMDGAPYSPSGEVVPHPTSEYGTLVKPIRSFELDLARGKIASHSRVSFVARNPDVDAPAGYPATVWTGGGGPYTFLAAARPLQVRSTSALDAAAGTGAQAVSLVLLDANYAKSAVQVSLNGTAPVALGTWLRLNSAFAARVTPTPGHNEGDIIIETADLPTVRVGHIAVHSGRAEQAVYTVPAATTALATVYRSGIYRTAAAAAVAQIEVMTWTPGGVWVRLYVTQHNMQGEISHTTTPPIPVLLPEKTDVVVNCVHVSNDNTQAFVSAQFIEVNFPLDDETTGGMLLSYLLQEDGDALLLEDGGLILLEAQ